MRVRWPLSSPRPSGPLLEHYPAEMRSLVHEFIWRTNPAPRPDGGDGGDRGDGLRLQLGCGDNPFPGFVNVDFLPSQRGVLGWNLLDRWPDELAGRVRCAFSEDVLEHFFYEEQSFVLCEMNRALAPGGVFRVLMPDLSGLVRSGQEFDAKQREAFFVRDFGVSSGADAINLGMRFGGHRWLHDPESFAALARRCGFEPISTSCRESTLPELCDLNLRDESNSLSFATDLRKVEDVARWRLAPDRVVSAKRVGDLAEGHPLFKSSGRDPQVHYRFEAGLDTDRIVVIAIRGANLSQFREHNHSEAYLVERADRSLPIDSSMRSTRHTSFVAAPLISSRHSGDLVDSLRFDPAARRGDYFTTGPAEIYVRGEAPASTT